MKNIDFLPDIYRQRAAMRNARIWWGVVVLIFGAAIVSTAVVQSLVRRSVKHQLQALEPEYFAAQEKVLRLSNLQAQSRTAGEMAALVTYLESAWPRTQILAEVVSPAPPSLRMTALNIVEEELPRPPTEEAAPRRRGKNSDEAEVKLSPPLADLERLRQEHDYRVAAIEIVGEASDLTELHDYVAQLGAAPLVAQAQIKSLEAATAESKTQQTQFTLLVRVRPNYCQPGGDSKRNSPPASQRKNETTSDTNPKRQRGTLEGIEPSFARQREFPSLALRASVGGSQ